MGIENIPRASAKQGWPEFGSSTMELPQACTCCLARRVSYCRGESVGS